VKFNALDGFLGIGDRIRARNEAGDPAVFKLEVRVNGELKQTVRFSQLVRPADKLLADVSEFMTLGPGDMLMLGTDAGRPRVRAGDHVEIKMPALGTLTNLFVAEAA
jgi:5-oxopent-3-ene-1,2,5-tricarboxylate decarboxylase/2-hydroxyhepta-2,4-diene-1,7-dioate isomerase